MSKKKRSVFQLFMIPLIFIILAQALLTYWIIYSSGTLGLIDESSVSTLSQTVRNRKIILENNMVQQWSGVKEETSTMNARFGELLKDHEITAAAFKENSRYQQEFLGDILTDCLYMMRKNNVTGTFVVLANNEAGQIATSLEGVYFRDSDPLSNPGDYSDVLMVRGDSAFSHELGVPFDTLWKPKFAVEAAGTRAADDFILKPYMEAGLKPEIGYSNLAYWSNPFCLEGNVAEDSYHMITYTVPLIYNGSVYGVLGVEVSVPYFVKYLPKNELDTDDENGYLLLAQDADGKIRPLIAEGTTEAYRIGEKSELEFKKTRYRGLYELAGSISGSGKMYACLEPFRLYNTNAPFSDTVWMLAGFRSSESLFGAREDIVRHLFLSLFIALLFGIAGSYLTVRMVAGPINKLEKCIKESPENEMKRFDATGVREVDSLADVVRNLTEKQKESENSLIEEKERYRLALESSSDIMFTFDLGRNALDILSLKDDDAETEHEWRDEDAERTVYPEDLGTVRFLFQNIKDNMVIQFRTRWNPDQEYQWVEMSCRAVYDTDNRRSKIIGRIKNIHAEKLEELKHMEEERHDPVTGLLSVKFGIDRVTRDMKYGAGALILMDVDRFRELNERFGMVFGDSIMEEIGRIILDMSAQYQADGRDLVGIRAGGDEMIIWLPRANERESAAVVGCLRRQLEETYGGESPQVSLSYGISVYNYDEKNFGQLFEEACRALCCSKRMNGSQLVVYDHMTESQKKLAADRTSINEIASLAYTDKLNMVSQVFNFFDKSNDVHAIIPVLLVKLGNHYRASGIIIMQADREFHTAYVGYRWSKSRKQPEKEQILRFDQPDYRVLEEAVSEGSFSFSDVSELGEDKQRFLFIPDDCAGICIPMYDKGIFMGEVSFLREPETELWEIPEKNELVEITKLLETNINNQRYDLASRAKSDFLSRMSHEIRTPMNAIIGMTEIAMKRQGNPDAVEDCLIKIENSSKYLLSLINDILDMSKIESGKMKLEISDFSVKDMLEGIDSMIRPQAEGRRIRFVQDTELIQEWVKGDSLHLNQVVINLLSNALKFTPQNGTITLTVKQTARGNGIEHYFAVQDTGIGIRNEDLTRIFNSFEQAENPAGQRTGGTGLGLTISSRFVRMMGGEIEVQSEVGAGSEFYFSVLLQPGVETAKSRTENADMPAEGEISFAGKRILLVEDNELNAEIAQTILEMHQAFVEGAVNGKEAVDMFLDHEPGYYSLILMDVLMPVMDGLEATREIRRSGRPDSATVPIIAMSANAFDEDMKKSVESGMNGHLAKPIDVPEFLRVLNRELWQL